MKEMQLGKGILVHDENGYDYHIDGKSTEPDPVRREFAFSGDYPELCMKLVLHGDLCVGTKKTPFAMSEELEQNEELKQFFAGRPLCRTVAFEHPGYVYTYAWFDRLPSGRWQLRRYWEEIADYHGRTRTVDHGSAWCEIPQKMLRGSYRKFISDVCAAFAKMDGRSYFTQEELLNSSELRALYGR